MSPNRSVRLWIVNVISFIFLVIVSLTGMVNWLLLPRGYKGGENVLVSIRHFLREVHQWSALLLLVMIVIHMTLHWTYIKSNLQRHGLLK
jgi:predicted MFS family arabinose efflux permease